jgi:uncharacterized protein (TIGR03435 family)
MVRSAPPEWREILGELGGRIGLTRPVRLLVSALVQVPTVVGWLPPVVLVPVGALSGLPAEHLKALLLHELAHIRRHDYLINILQSAAEALLFYHPAVWWVSRHIRAERELCCDDVVVSVSRDALTYARALAQLESYRPAHLNAVVAANGGSLSNRIARLLGQPRPAVRIGVGPEVLGVAVLLLATAFGLFGQPDTLPKFEIATVKSPGPQDQVIVLYNYPGGRVVISLYTFALLLNEALDVQRFQVVGAPAWIDSQRFMIEGKPPASSQLSSFRPANPEAPLVEEQRQMLLALLMDRFQLKFHRESQEGVVYLLTKGNKEPAFESPKHPEYRMFFAGLLGGGDGTVSGGNATMEFIASKLSRSMGTPVLDRTGLTGPFDFKLEQVYDWEAEHVTEVTIAQRTVHALGLKLERSHGPIETIVIDHLEKPSGN